MAGSALNQNFVELIQGYATDNAKVTLPVSSPEWGGRVQLCAVLYYLLPQQLVSYQNLKHPDPRNDEKFQVSLTLPTGWAGGLKKLSSSRKLSSKCFILGTQKPDIQNHLFIF